MNKIAILNLKSLFELSAVSNKKAPAVSDRSNRIKNPLERIISDDTWCGEGDEPFRCREYPGTHHREP